MNLLAISVSEIIPESSENGLEAVSKEMFIEKDRKDSYLQRSFVHLLVNEDLTIVNDPIKPLFPPR